MSWNQKQKVQARDPDSGVWLAAVVLTVDEEAVKVKWVNYKGRTSFVDVSEEIRRPILRRQVRVSPILWPSVKPEFLQAGDKVAQLSVDGRRGEVMTIETNDPFNGVMLTCEHPGREFRYEHLAEPEEDEGEPEDVPMELESEVEDQHDSDDEEDSLLDAAILTPMAQATPQATPRRAQATPRRAQATPRRAQATPHRAQTTPRATQATRGRQRGRTATHVKKKVATLLDFGEGTIFDEEIPPQELEELTEERALAAVGDLAEQVQALDKAPNFDLPAGMGADVLLQQNIDLLERNETLIQEKESLLDRINGLETRVSAIEAKISQDTPAIEVTPPTIRQTDPTTQPTPQPAPQPARRSPLAPIQAMNPSRVAVELSKELFTTDERLHCCVNGKGRAQLDPQRVTVLRRRLFLSCPMPRSQQDAAWKAAVKAIDGHTRYLRLKEKRGRENLPQ
ncbi:uncharacterized protein LOC121431373 isoform X2 [Lytechinus variegatus]|uniref:uncharacterized protein LOC121431373 isoform X2 n=1 Tax=Lytechinus variegatus TaxID=7654 RepID=UPI001BB19B52|nr:uncharacterized protein LOC121431373 isoform X2 [Lytechinus variegatus]